MDGPVFEPTKVETDILREMARHFDSGQQMSETASLKGWSHLSDEERRPIILRLMNFTQIKIRSHSAISITDDGRQTIHRLDHPAPTDYPATANAWFRSRKWSIPLLVLVVGVPALWKWVEMVVELLKWLRRPVP